MGEKLGSQPVNPGGAFQFPSILPGDYDLAVNGLPPGYYVRSVLQSGRDCAVSGVNPADGAIHLELAADGAIVAGRTVDTKNNPAPDAAVLLIPGSGAQTPMTVSDQSGAFRLDGSFPPGDYRLLALTGVRPDQAQDPDLIGRYLGAAAKVTLSPGESKALTLEVHSVTQQY